MYSIWDTEVKRNLATGRNVETEYECVQAGVEYLTEDWDIEEDREKMRSGMTLKEKKEALLGYNFMVYEHTQPVEEFDRPACLDG